MRAYSLSNARAMTCEQAKRLPVAEGASGGGGAKERSGNRQIGLIVAPCYAVHRDSIESGIAS